MMSMRNIGVFFVIQDFDQHEADEAREATLLFRVDETTGSAAQFLAHYSFTPVDEPDLGIQLRGGTPLQTDLGNYGDDGGDREEGVAGDDDDREDESGTGRDWSRAKLRSWHKRSICNGCVSS